MLSRRTLKKPLCLYLKKVRNPPLPRLLTPPHLRRLPRFPFLHRPIPVGLLPFVAKVQKRVPATTAKSVGPANGDLSPVTYSTVSEIAPDPGTTVTVNGQERFRDVRAGKGQIHFGVFTPVDELFVQFGVFCKDTPVTHAPAVDGVYLVWHAESTCPSGDKGAAYIVKGLPTAEEAKEEVKQLKAQGIDCWYNPALTGAKVEIIGVR